MYSLYADTKNRLWIGTLDGGLDCLDLSTGEWMYYRAGDKHNAIHTDIGYSLSGDSKGDIFVGTSSGVNWIEPETGKVSSFDGQKMGVSGLRTESLTWYFLIAASCCG